MGVQVTMTDEASGETDSIVIGDGADGYVLICGPGCDVVHTQAHANGTRILTLKPTSQDNA